MRTVVLRSWVVHERHTPMPMCAIVTCCHGREPPGFLDSRHDLSANLDLTYDSKFFLNLCCIWLQLALTWLLASLRLHAHDT